MNKGPYEHGMSLTYAKREQLSVNWEESHIGFTLYEDHSTHYVEWKSKIRQGDL